ncbi:hydroxyethylthiazole kinase [Clostridium acidisoli DSM 12555]|uniref:Hydroxyethylthiazole kinase n=1 Tax=Clostridium acidisoli DSM 12555 TaxID=1121291 RepID=A0A1W1XTK7_9CLOT|nr:hydroxyethylthiazole kinase [Clostridium acidisoli]SMC27227.1 hydroxyethylthiazole kinase [Clostridium acidisoli DSM 12555]
MINEISSVVTKLRERVPLVQAITNYVTINDCANILLAFGASPAMSEAYDESYEFAKISNALYLNVGTLTKEQETSMIMASISAKKSNISVVLDPVGCAGIQKKMDVVKRILELGRVDIIKGNGGEIKSLAGQDSKVRGVDSIDGEEGIEEAVKFLANEYKCVVVATGKRDFISDGKRMAIISNGVELLTKVTGAGCMLGALCAGTAGAEKDKFAAACTAVISMGIAGEKAYEEAKKPGSFKVKLMDAIYDINEETIKELAKIEFI